MWTVKALQKRGHRCEAFDEFLLQILIVSKNVLVWIEPHYQFSLAKLALQGRF